jgi:hypothetical protein
LISRQVAAWRRAAKTISWSVRFWRFPIWIASFFGTA